LLERVAGAWQHPDRVYFSGGTTPRVYADEIELSPYILDSNFNEGCGLWFGRWEEEARKLATLNP
jgi:hypothetical protein